ncbi:hypothetical protein ES705_27475 [subsurface metagenome]
MEIRCIESSSRRALSGRRALVSVDRSSAAAVIVGLKDHTGDNTEGVEQARLKIDFDWDLLTCVEQKEYRNLTANQPA